MQSRFLLLPLIVLVFAVGACSADDEVDDVASLETTASIAENTAPSADPEVESEQSLLDFTQCMRDSGVDMGDPTMDVNGNLQLPPIEFEASPELDPEAAMAEMDASFAECEQHLQGVVFNAVEPGSDTAFEDALVDYAGCMRDHGIDIPDPDFSGSSGMIDLGSGSPANEAEFEAAHGECKEILAGVGLDF